MLDDSNGHNVAVVALTANSVKDEGGVLVLRDETGIIVARV